MRSRPMRAVLVLAALWGSGLFGYWIGQRRAETRERPPLVLRGTVRATPATITTRVGGRVRLVAVRVGDVVKAGQLVAWMEAPELREAVEAAEEQVRSVQQRLNSLRAARPTRAQERAARAEAEAETAQRRLEDAQQMSAEAPALAQRLEAAQAAQELAAARLLEARARLQEAQAVAESLPDESTGGGTDSSDVGTGDSGSGSVRIRPADRGTSSQLAAVERARRELQAAEQLVADLTRRLRRAEAAGTRLADLQRRAEAAAAAAMAARAEVEEAAGPGDGPAAEEILRQELQQAQATAAQARARLKETLVVATVPGIVEEVAGTGGEILGPGEVIARLGRLDALWTEVEVAAAHASRVRPNTVVTVRSPSLPGAVFSGTVTRVTPGSAGRDAPVAAKVFITTAGRVLRPGAQVAVTIP